MKSTAHLLAVIVGLGIAPAPMVFADPFSTEGQRGSVTPYLWGLSVTGDASVGPISTDVDISFSDLLENLNFALMVEGEYWNGRWGILGNYLLSDIESDLAGPLSTSSDIRMMILGAAVGYRFGPFGDSGKRSIFDAYAGLRHTDLDVRLTTGGGATAQRDVNFTDPIIGGRFMSEISPKSHFVVGGDIGGFGEGSDFSWQAYGLYSRDVNLGQTPASLIFGYRALGLEYETGGAIPLSVDITSHGPVAALTFRF